MPSLQGHKFRNFLGIWWDCVPNNLNLTLHKLDDRQHVTFSWQNQGEEDRA
jgi:hypothetical protein